ncbi:hypothetical protein B0A50_01458 [Salinomyces thailandicus]|uniref:Uncharacterized protein n=1 Tax=Salinomyces thailandicus TaxID=706561 RepID=A0A4U0UCB5_9PEZI|nr:hypothetical protein B0A50_01458 [Salinomyces thailandica]
MPDRDDDGIGSSWKGFCFMAMAAGFTTKSAYDNDRPRSSLLLLTFHLFMFLLGTIMTVADAHDDGRPSYKRILTTGFTTGLGVTALLTLFLGITTYYPLAVGMWAQVFAMGVQIVVEATKERLKDSSTPATIEAGARPRYVSPQSSGEPLDEMRT